MRWQRWIQRVVWGAMLKVLQWLKGIDLQWVLIDSTVIRAHQHAAGAVKALRP
jgi:hypothetical protein